MYVSHTIRDPRTGEEMIIEFARDDTATDMEIQIKGETFNITIPDFQLIELSNMIYLMTTLTIQKAPPTIPPVQE